MNVLTRLNLYKIIPTSSPKVKKATIKRMVLNFAVHVTVQGKTKPI